MNSITTFVPQRNLAGQFASFKSSVKKTFKVVKIVYLVATLLGTIWGIYATRQHYNVRCSVNGQIVAWFNTKQVCGQLAENAFDSTQLAQEQNQLQELTQNQDLYAK